jgi:alpha-L-arabinofuranosidase
VLRFWAGQLGDTLGNLIADPYGRQRAGYSAFLAEQDDISYGLQEFLQLSEWLGAEPWFVVPTTFSVTDASNLIEYLAGASSTPYGSKRAARGHPNPWSTSFTKIPLEFGNEAWNGVFKGGAIEYPEPYGQRAQTIFGAMRYLSPNGVAEGVSGGLMSLNQQAIQTSSHPVPLVMYEMNRSTLAGSITQTALNSYASSLGAELAVTDAMLQ